MNIICKFLIFLPVMLLISSCDIIEGPFVEEGYSSNDTSEVIHKILLEDFTGHKCGNCPRAAEMAMALYDIYGDQIVIVSTHIGFFAKPNSSDTTYTTDFRTEAGEDYEEFWDIDAQGLPKGAVNRREISGNLILDYGNWGTVITEVVNEEPQIEFTISSNYTESNHELSLDIATKVLTSFSGTYNLVVYLTEDSIITWQKDYEANPEDIPDYVHRHVLRDAINGSWGETIIDNETVNDEYSFNNEYTYTLDGEWDADKCAVVTYLYNTDTKEVIQVEEKKITE